MTMLTVHEKYSSKNESRRDHCGAMPATVTQEGQDTD